MAHHFSRSTRAVAAFVVLAGLACSGAAAQERHADPGLELLLPRTLGGTMLKVESQKGTDLGTGSAAFDAFLAALGKTRGDFSIASAYSESGLKAEIGAWRVAGSDTAALMPGFARAIQASSATPLTVATVELAGRQVTRIGAAGELARGPIYAVARGDSLLFVETPDAGLAEEAISKLPR